MGGHERICNLSSCSPHGEVEGAGNGGSALLPFVQLGIGEGGMQVRLAPDGRRWEQGLCSGAACPAEARELWVEVLHCLGQAVCSGRAAPASLHLLAEPWFRSAPESSGRAWRGLCPGST